MSCLERCPYFNGAGFPLYIFNVRIVDNHVHIAFSSIKCTDISICIVYSMECFGVHENSL